MHKHVLDPDNNVLVIHDFISSEECAALIRRSEALVYEAGTVADVVIEQVRNEGAVVHSGQKYVLRTDVMYKEMKDTCN